MDRKKTAAAATVLALLGGGSAVAVDNQIDPYTEKEATYEVQIEGETVEISKDRPEVKLNRWGGEESLTVKKSGEYGEAKRGWFSRQQRWQKGNESVIVEPIKSAEGENIANADTGGEEGFKVDILLNEKPDTNVFTLELEGWEDLDFFYQPELTEEEIAEGAERPENVVGSYAVYHKEKANHRIGGTNYQTGKLYHIYRPKVVDSEGNEVWGQLGYESGLLSVTVPQEFLDSAVYPVRVDPTFGYTSVGATAGSEIDDLVWLFGNLTAFGGTVDSISMYRGNDTGVNRWKMAVYTNIAYDPQPVSANFVGETVEGVDTTAGWNTLNASGTVNLSSDIASYGLAWWDEAGTVNTYRYDLGSKIYAGHGLTYSGGAFPDPFVVSNSGSSTIEISIYATYTAVDPAFTVIAQTASSSSGAMTTNSIDTTGADLIVIGLAVDDGYNTDPTDSKSNTWTQATSYTQGNVRVRLWYTTPSSVGSGHTFSFSGSPFGTMFVAAFSGADQTSPYDQQSGANAFAASLATGSITPTEDNELIVGLYGINSAGARMGVDNGLVELNEVDFSSGNYYGGMMAYKVQTTAAAINPTFTRTNSNGQAATIVSFKRAADAPPAASSPSQSVIFFE